MANKWGKLYTEATITGNVSRKLGFATLKHAKDSANHDEIVDRLDDLVDSQIELERRNACKEYDRGWYRGLWTGAGCYAVGSFIGLALLGKKLDKK